MRLAKAAEIAILAQAFRVPAVISIALFALGVGAAPASADTLELKPKAEWKLSEYDDKCRISGNFGKGDDQLSLWIEKGGPGLGINLTLIGDPVRHPYGPNVRIAFAPEPAVDRAYIKLKSSKGRPVLTMFGVQPVTSTKQPSENSEAGESETIDLPQGTLSDEPLMVDFAERFGAISALELSGAVIQPLSLELEGFGKIMGELAECTNTLSERLSGNSIAGYNKGSPVTPTGQAEWAQKIQANYPFHLLRQGEEGSVGVRLTINAAGRASYCEVVAYSGPPSFNDTACLLLLRHARFTPARNEEGEAIPAFYSTKVTYRLRK